MSSFLQSHDANEFINRKEKATGDFANSCGEAAHCEHVGFFSTTHISNDLFAAMGVQTKWVSFNINGDCGPKL